MPDNIVDEALNQCVFAVGCGAGMKIERKPLTKLRNHVADPAGAATGLRHELTKPADPQNPADPAPGTEARWKLHDEFVLDCCVAIGRLAAAKAVARGSRVIQEQDLNAAFTAVSQENHGALPGPFCPDL